MLVGWAGAVEAESSFRPPRRAQIFLPPLPFIGFVTIDITQHQTTDDEEQRRQYRYASHSGHGYQNHLNQIA